MFGGKQRRVREFFERYERPRVLVAGKGDQPTYDGVLMEVLDDALVLTNARISVPTSGEPKWTPVDGSLIIERSNVLYVQSLNGGPG